MSPRPFGQGLRFRRSTQSGSKSISAYQKKS